MSEPRQDQALRLVERLIEISPDAATRKRLTKMRGRMRLPMTEVLAELGDFSVIEKAQRLGVSRQAVYGWLDGTSRPGPRMARKLARLTGFDADEIRGHDDGDLA
jgi:transcriptional regulator with XRE-family HTH domain